jgi:hypothetical protein
MKLIINYKVLQLLLIQTLFFAFFSIILLNNPVLVLLILTVWPDYYVPNVTRSCGNTIVLPSVMGVCSGPQTPR